MKANQSAVAIPILLVVMSSACSSNASIENKLLGEWYLSGPEVVRLSITNTTTNSDGFHGGFSETRNGQTSTSDWRIAQGDQGPLLILQARGVFNDLLRNTSQGAATQSRHKIVTLTADTLVVEWNNVGSFLSGVPDRQEYLNVNSAVFAERQRQQEQARQREAEDKASRIK